MSTSVSDQFQRLAGSFGAFGWSGERHSVQLSSGDARRLNRSLMKSAEEETILLMDIARKRLTEHLDRPDTEREVPLSRTVRSRGIKVERKHIIRLLVQEDRARGNRFVIGSLQFDPEELVVAGYSPGAEVVIGKDHVVSWTAIESITSERVRLSRDYDFSGSWAGRPLYETLASIEVRERAARRGDTARV